MIPCLSYPYAYYFFKIMSKTITNIFNSQPSQSKKTSYYSIQHVLIDEYLNNLMLMTENLVLYILKGKIVIENSHDTIFVKANELFLQSKGENIMVNIIPDNGQFECLYFIFDPELVVDVLRTIHDEMSIMSKNESGNLHFCHFQQNDRIELFFNSLLNTSWQNNEYYEALFKLKLKELIMILLTDGTTRSQVATFLKSNLNCRSNKLMQIVYETLYTSISISELASICGMSLSSFKRAFYMEFNMSPMQWINEKRLDRAILLIKNTSIPITEIAYNCGYESYVHFSRRFKSKYGCSAKAFRGN